jgi:hypothetical protein
VRFIANAYSYPKDEQYPREWEDGAGYLVDGDEGWFVVTDGASSGFRVREWARLLVEGFLHARPRDPRGTQEALVGRRPEWAKPVPRPPGETREWWDEDDDAGRVGAAAFAGVYARTQQGGDTTFQVFAYGDCCVLHVRDSTLQTSFPISSAQAFTQDPELIYTDDRPPPQPDWIRFCGGRLRPGDLLVLASDRLSQCLLEQSGLSGDHVWQAVRAIDGRSFQTLVAELRRTGALGIDDVTLLRVDVVGP